MAGSTGLEPATSGVTGRRSNQLNYDPAVANHPITKYFLSPNHLSLNHQMVLGGTGIEPVTAGV